MKKCPKCGAECSDDANFCTQCQTKFDKVLQGVEKILTTPKLFIIYDDDSFEIEDKFLGKNLCSGAIADIVSCQLEDGLINSTLILQLKQQEAPFKFVLGTKLDFYREDREDVLNFVNYVYDATAEVRMEDQEREEQERLVAEKRAAEHGVEKKLTTAKLIIVYDDDSFEIEDKHVGNIICSGAIADIVSCRLEDGLINSTLILQLKRQETPLNLVLGTKLDFHGENREDVLNFINYVHDVAAEVRMEDLEREEQERLVAEKREAEKRAAQEKQRAEERAAEEKRRAEERAAQAKREAAAKAAKARRVKLASDVSKAIDASEGEQKAMLSALYLIYETLKDINVRLAQTVPAGASTTHGSSRKRARDLAFDDAFKIAQEHIENRRTHEARDVLKRLKDEYVPDYDVLFHLAVVYLDLHRKEQGIETINEARRMNERDPRAYKVLAMIYQDTDVNRALAEIDEAIYLDPSDAGSHIVKAEIMMTAEEPQGVLDSCNRAIELAPELPDPYVMICKVAKFIKDEKLYNDTLAKLEKVSSSAADHVKQLFYKSLTQKLEEAVDAIEDSAWKLAGPSIRMQNIGNMFGAAFRRD